MYATISGDPPGSPICFCKVDNWFWQRRTMEHPEDMGQCPRKSQNYCFDSCHSLWCALAWFRYNVSAGFTDLWRRYERRRSLKYSEMAWTLMKTAHHCIGKHPANKIMRDYYHPLLDSRGSEAVPHILGLTASPIMKSNVNVKSLRWVIWDVSKASKGLTSTDWLKVIWTHWANLLEFTVQICVDSYTYHSS